MDKMTAYVPYRQRQQDDAALLIQHQQLQATKKQQARLQRQLMARIEEVEAKQQERNEEIKRKEQQILNRLHRTEYLNGEISRQYGGQADKKVYSHFSSAQRDSGSPRPRLIDDLLAQRNRKQHLRQQEYQDNISFLNRERHRLLDEQLDLDNYRRDLFVVSPISDTESIFSDSDWQRLGHVMKPPPLSPPSNTSVNVVQSFIEQTKDQLPDEIEKFHKMKEQFDRDYERLYKPYNGELSIDTYEPWQLKDYHMVRSIVEEAVDQVLNMFFLNLPPAVDKQTALALMNADQLKLDRQRQHLAEDKSARLITEEIILEMTSVLSTEVSNEFLYIYQMVSDRTDQLIISKAEGVASEAEEEERSDREPAYDLITRLYLNHQRQRDRYRPRLWAHTQNVIIKGLQQQQQQEEEPDSEDVSVLDFDDITPSDMQQNEAQPWDSAEDKDRKERHRSYMQREVQHWKDMASNITSISLSKKTNGVFTSCLSPNHRYLAVGTVHGDILVYDLWSSPPLLIRVTHRAVAEDNSVKHLAWSMDACRLIAVYQKGEMEIWSMMSTSVQKSDLKGLELKYDDMGVAPSTPTQILSLEGAEGDFMFQSGGIARLGGQKSNRAFLPSIAEFYPSITLMGSQHSVCVVLDNSDILKLDTEKGRPGQDHNLLFTPRVTQPNLNSQNENKVGQNLSTELFRHHRHPIILVGFINKDSDMLSVDVKGHVNVWKYTRNELTSFEWFTPFKKYRLNMMKTMFTATPNAKPNIVFSDKTRDSGGRQQPQTRQDLANKRQQAQETISSLKLGDPWHQEYKEEQDLLTEYYQPTDSMPESGAQFHIVVRHMASNQLSAYVTKFYSPVKISATKLIGCRLSPAGDHLLFLLLFPPYPPKEGHLTLISVDTQTLLVENFRRDIALNDILYTKCLNEEVVWFEVSKVLKCPGSAYAFVNVDGSLSAYSINTGIRVLKLKDNKSSADEFVGHVINMRGSQVANNAHFVVACSKAKMTIVVYTRNQKKKIQNQLLLIELKANSSEEQLEQLEKAFNEWDSHPELPAAELMLDMSTSST